MKVQKIYKYPTGAEIPEGAIYLSTVTQTHMNMCNDTNPNYQPCWLVWHYFLVTVEH